MKLIKRIICLLTGHNYNWKKSIMANFKVEDYFICQLCGKEKIETKNLKIDLGGK